MDVRAYLILLFDSETIESNHFYLFFNIERV